MMLLEGTLTPHVQFDTQKQLLTKILFNKLMKTCCCTTSYPVPELLTVEVISCHQYNTRSRQPLHCSIVRYVTTVTIVL